MQATGTSGGLEAVGQLPKSCQHDGLRGINNQRAPLDGALIFLVQRLRRTQEEASDGSSPECLEDTSGNRLAKSAAILSTRYTERCWPPVHPMATVK